jgi:Type II/IV secretion system protein
LLACIIPTRARDQSISWNDSTNGPPHAGRVRIAGDGPEQAAIGFHAPAPVDRCSIHDLYLSGKSRPKCWGFVAAGPAGPDRSTAGPHRADGCFVLSTIHTNDTLSAVTRLQDMGIEPFLLSCTLRVLEAQRLVRQLCPKCKEAYEVDEELAARHGLTPGEVLYRPKGCLQCRRLGYRGRLGVFEVIRITPRLTQLIQKRVPLDQLRKAAREEGMKMLYDSALDKVRQGLTSLEAALSVTMAEEE